MGGRIHQPPEWRGLYPTEAAASTGIREMFVGREAETLDLGRPAEIVAPSLVNSRIRTAAGPLGTSTLRVCSPPCEFAPPSRHVPSGAGVLREGLPGVTRAPQKAYAARVTSLY